MSDPQPTDYSLEICIQTANDDVLKRGGKVYQKFTCAQCLSRQTMAQADIFFAWGTCEECGYTTDIRKSGCNYLAEFPLKKGNENG